MTILSELYASGGRDVILHTIELQCPAWTDPICIVKDFRDHTIITEDARTLTAKASGMAIALPKRDATGTQNLTFAIDNVRSEASRLLRAANENRQLVTLIYRCYLASDLSAPAERPIKFIVRSYKAQAQHVEITAGLFDLINLRWPRHKYDAEFSPGLKYLQ